MVVPKIGLWATAQPPLPSLFCSTCKLDFDEYPSGWDSFSFCQASSNHAKCSTLVCCAASGRYPSLLEYLPFGSNPTSLFGFLSASSNDCTELTPSGIEMLSCDNQTHAGHPHCFYCISTLRNAKAAYTERFLSLKWNLSGSILKT